MDGKSVATSTRLPVFLMGTVACALAFSPALFRFSVPFCLTFSISFGLFSVLLFPFVLSPWLRWWSRSLKREVDPYAFTAVLLVTLLWTCTLLGILLAILEDFFLFQTLSLLPFLDGVLAEVTLWELGAIMVAGLVGCTGSRTLVKRNSDEFFTGSRWFILPLLLVWGWLGYRLIPLYWDGHEFDESLLKEHERVHPCHFYEIDQSCSKYGFPSYLPQEFREQPLVKALCESSEGQFQKLMLHHQLDTLLESTDKPQPAHLDAVANHWLESMRELMHQEEFWRDNKCQALCRFADVYFSYPWNRDKFPDLIEAEIQTRCAIVLLDEQRFVTSQPSIDWVAENELSGEAWELYIEIGLSRPDLHLAKPVNRYTGSELFLTNMVRLMNDWERCTDMPYFQALESRRKLNLEWREFLTRLPQERKAPPDVETLHNPPSSMPFPEFDLLRESYQRVDFVTSLILADLKSSRVPRPTPRDKLSYLRPEIADVAKYYSGWFDIHEEKSITVLTVQPYFPQQSPKIYRVWRRPNR